MEKTRQSEENSTIENRSTPRLKLMGNASILATVSNRNYYCTLLDLSAGGAKIQFPEPLEPFEEISIAHESLGKLSGERVWQASDIVGIKFDEIGRAHFSAPPHACP